MKRSVLILLFGICVATVLQAQRPPDTTSNQSAAVKEDPAAKKFVRECTSCHTIGAGKLKGPDLITAITWKQEDLAKAVKKMEKEVGAMSDQVVTDLVTLMREPALKARLAAEEQRLIQSRRALLAPPDASIGHDLFWGARRFQNGGMNCSACHAVNGLGGTLGPDLTPAAKKMGEVALISAVEKAAYKVMEPHYRTRPVTAQEALHLAAYLAQAPLIRANAEFSFHMLAVLAAVGLSGAIVALYAAAGKKQSPSGN